MSAADNDRTPPPPILPLIRENLPLADLALYPHCVTWALEWHKSENGKAGWTKVPKSALTGRNAKANDPSTWSTAADVLRRHDRFGYEVWDDDPFTFLDVDNGIDAAGEIKPWAQAIVDRFPNGYWERSTTGTGLKGLIRGRSPERRPEDGRTRNRGKILIGDGKVEVFYWGKFTAITGHRLDNSSATIGDGQAALEAFIAEHCPAPVPRPIVQPASSSVDLTADEQTIIKRVLDTAKGHKLHGAGDISGYSSRSEAVLALLNLYVSAWATRDQVDSLIRASALFPTIQDRWANARLRKLDTDKAFDGTVVPFEGYNKATIAEGPHRREKVAAAPDQTLGFPPEPCANRVAELERQLAAAMATIARQAAEISTLKHQLGALQHVQSISGRILGNKALGPTRVVAAAITNQIAWRATAGDTPPKEIGVDVPSGMMPISLEQIERFAGVSKNTASSHIQSLEDRGLIRRHVQTVKFADAGDVNQSTGEIYQAPQYVTQLFIGPAKITPLTAQAAIDLAKTLADYSIERTERRGGKRTPRCPDHPKADVIRVFEDTCSVCHAVLNDGSYPLPAALLDPPIEPQNLGFTEETSPTVVTSSLWTTNFGIHSSDRTDRTLVAKGPPIQAPPLFEDRCLDCGAAVEPGQHYCSKHGGAAPLDQWTDVAHGAPA